MAAKQRIGVVGVGRMGANIARRLKDVGYDVAAVYDVRGEVAHSVANELGARAAQTLSQVNELSDIVITVVTDDKAMRTIYATEGDSLLNGSRNRLYINCATISPGVHVEVEKLVARRGGQTLEACMASSIPQARDGTLYLMVGGTKEAFERAKPLLENMSSSLTYVGKAGEAAKVKALVNMVMNINTAGLAEGLGLGEALGLDLTMLREVFSQTGAASRVLVTDGEDMQNRSHDCYFSAAHAAKDSGIAVALAQEAGLELPLAANTKRQFDRMVELGLGELDKSGVAELTFASRHARQHAPA
jgi:3-hydroxyisobutyrate dehydrogenase